MPVAALTATIATIEVQQQDGAASTSAPHSTAATATPSAATTLAPATTPTIAAAETTADTDTPPASVTTAGSLTTAGTLSTAVTSSITARLSTAAVSGATASISATALAAYQRAASVVDQADTDCNLSWQLLAAIGHVESGDGTANGNQLNESGIATPGIYGAALDGTHHTQKITDTDGGQLDGDTAYDRAVGPMQILPATWVLIAVDGDGDGRRDPQDINDAALASAVYLCSGGGDLSTTAGQRTALLRYNHSDAYATEVLTLTSSYQADSNGITAVPATFLVPSATTTGGTGDAATTKKHSKQTKKKHHHKKHHTKAISSTDATGTTDATTSAPAPSTTADPTPTTTPDPTTDPTTDPTPTTGTAATAAELADLCRPAIATAYPDATDDALDAALDRCTQQLDGLTLEKAKAGLDDVVAALTDPDATGGPIAGLVPDEPSTAPSTTPSTEPSASASASAGS